MDVAPDATFPARRHNILCCLYMNLPECLVARLKEYPYKMDNTIDITTFESIYDGCPIGDVPFDNFNTGGRGEMARPLRLSQETPDPLPTFQQLPDEVAANKSSRACHEYHWVIKAFPATAPIPLLSSP